MGRDKNQRGNQPGSHRMAARGCVDRHQLAETWPSGNHLPLAQVLESPANGCPKIADMPIFPRAPCCLRNPSSKCMLGRLLYQPQGGRGVFGREDKIHSLPLPCLVAKARLVLRSTRRYRNRIPLVTYRSGAFIFPPLCQMTISPGQIADDNKLGV